MSYGTYIRLINIRASKLYLANALILVVPDKFYWYTLNYFTDLDIAFNAITSPFFQIPQSMA